MYPHVRAARRSMVPVVCCCAGMVRSRIEYLQLQSCILVNSSASDSFHSGRPNLLLYVFRHATVTHSSCTQVVAFIDRSSEVTTAGVANANVYYVMTYTSTLRAFTGPAFITNANRAVSSRVERFAWLGSLVGQDQGLLAVALNDLAERFEGLSLAASASAVVISASDGARNTPTTADALEAGDRLRASYSAPVSIATVALTSSESTQLVRRVVSRDVQLNRLSVSTTVLARVEAVLTSLTSTTGAVPGPV